MGAGVGVGVSVGVGVAVGSNVGEAMGVADGTGTAVDVGVSGCVQARTKTSTGELMSRNSLLVIASNSTDGG